jgi:hypothetical protein
MNVQRPTNISRILSLFLTGIMLLMAVVGPNWSSAPVMAKASVATEKQAGKATDQPEETVIKAASFEAVVTPATSFDFSQVVYLLPPTVQLTVRDLPKIPRLFEVPYFYFSYFRNVFGHHIATNAP